MRRTWWRRANLFDRLFAKRRADLEAQLIADLREVLQVKTTAWHIQACALDVMAWCARQSPSWDVRVREGCVSVLRPTSEDGSSMVGSSRPIGSGERCLERALLQCFLRAHEMLDG